MSYLKKNHKISMVKQRRFSGEGGGVGKKKQKSKRMKSKRKVSKEMEKKNLKKKLGETKRKKEDVGRNLKCLEGADMKKAKWGFKQENRSPEKQE